MKQYSIKSFPDILVTSTQFKKLRTRESKLLLLDRCNWLISAIFRDNIKNDKTYGTFVNLKSQILKKYLGDRTYTEIKMCLIGLGIIIENPKYLTSKFSKSFALTPKAIRLGVENTIIYSKKFDNKLKKLKEISFEETCSNPVLKKVLVNTSQLLVVEKPFYYVERILPDPIYIESENGLEDISEPISKFKIDRYDAYYNSFKSLNNIIDTKELFNSSINYRPSIAQSGRVYHTFASMPKYVRKCLRTKSNELIWEVDMSSAQPSIIFLEWLKYAKSNWNEKFKKEYDLCLKLLLSGGIYQYVQENSEYFNKIGDYAKLKKEILTVINAENKPTKGNLALQKLFPNVFIWINNIKKIDHRRVSHIGQRAEANIFVETYKEIPDDKFALIIHDCILTTEENVKYVKNLLINRVRDLYPNVIHPNYNLDKLFKEDLVSIPDDELMENKLKVFYEREMNKRKS